MRVTTGTAKGIQLQSVPGTETRPISDRVKQAVFSILDNMVRGARFLDLFAGTGGVGIEALSRGAQEAVFVEKQSRAVAVIRANLQRTRLQERARIVQADVFKYLERPATPFDLIYIAPPQYLGLWKAAILALDAHPDWLDEDGLAIVQIFPKEVEPLELVHLDLLEQRKYGSTLVLFYERRIDDEP